jgi:hypothetical protein
MVNCLTGFYSSFTLTHRKKYVCGTETKTPGNSIKTAGLEGASLN